MFDMLKQSGANGLAVGTGADWYINNIIAWQLPEPLKQVLYGDQMRLGTSWLRARGLKLCIYASNLGNQGAGLPGGFEYFGKVITDPVLTDQWITLWSQVINELQPDSFELLDECPDATLANNPALTFDAYWNWAIKCIDAYRAIKPDLNIMLTSCPFYDMHPMAANPIPRPNVTYAYHCYYLGSAPPSSWPEYGWFTAYRDGRLAEAKSLLETYLLDAHGVGAMLNGGLDLSFIFGTNYRTQSHWDAFLNDMYDFCRRHHIDSYFQHSFTTDTPYEMGIWNADYTQLNVMGQTWYQNMVTYPILTVNSTPIVGVPFTIDGISQTTPYAEKFARENHSVSFPSNVIVGSDTYNFSQWEDGSTNPQRMFPLAADATIIASYVLVQPPPAKGSIEVHAFFESTEIVTSGVIVETGQTFQTPTTIIVDPGTYVVRVNNGTQVKEQWAVVTQDQTIRLDFQFQPPAPISPLPKVLQVLAPILIGGISLSIQRRG